MRFLFAILVLVAACQTETNPCIPLAEQACQMATQRAKGKRGDPEGAAKACEEVSRQAKEADEALQARCAQDISNFRKGRQ